MSIISHQLGHTLPLRCTGHCNHTCIVLEFDFCMECLLVVVFQVVAVELKLAGERGREVILLWNGGVSDQVCDPRDWSWNRIENRTCTM